MTDAESPGRTQHPFVLVLGSILFTGVFIGGVIAFPELAGASHEVTGAYQFGVGLGIPCGVLLIVASNNIKRGIRGDQNEQ